VQTFRLPVMAQLLRETSCVNIWDGYRNRYRARVVGPSDDIRLDCRVCKKVTLRNRVLILGGLRCRRHRRERAVVPNDGQRLE